jgi:hypothetical protein
MRTGRYEGMWLELASSSWPRSMPRSIRVNTWTVSRRIAARTAGLVSSEGLLERGGLVERDERSLVSFGQDAQEAGHRVRGGVQLYATGPDLLCHRRRSVDNQCDISQLE